MEERYLIFSYQDACLFEGEQWDFFSTAFGSAFFIRNVFWKLETFSRTCIVRRETNQVSWVIQHFVRLPCSSGNGRVQLERLASLLPDSTSNVCSNYETAIRNYFSKENGIKSNLPYRNDHLGLQKSWLSDRNSFSEMFWNNGNILKRK